MAPKAAMARVHVLDESGQVPSHAPGLGLAADEIVLRGGFLEGPAVYGGCTRVGGAMFMPPPKSCPLYTSEAAHQRTCSAIGGSDARHKMIVRG